MTEEILKMTTRLSGRAAIISGLTLIIGASFVGERACSQSLREFSLYQNLDLVGDDIQPWLRNYTLEGCKRACASNSQCQAFTFNVKQSVCIQKYGYGGPNVNADAISGATRPIVGIDYQGGDLDNGQRGISAGQCFTLCSSNPKCVGFAYVQAKNWCWQKAQLMPPEVKADVMSWAKGPTISTVPVQATLMPGSSETQSKQTGKRIQMRLSGNSYIVPVLINDRIWLDFIVDTGADEVSIPADVATTLMRTGTITMEDIGSEQKIGLANGGTAKSTQFRIHSLQVGKGDDAVIAQNVAGGISGPQGALLLGQTFLRRFPWTTIDHVNSVLIIDGSNR
jgi:predicted aspartyl protease